MAVYVDDYNAQYGRMVMCHMIADTRDELDLMADRIGVKRKWIQHPGEWNEHYDVCQSKRALAIVNGANAISPRELVMRLAARREARVTPKAPQWGGRE